MSTRRELLPPELIEELQRLQDRVAPLPFEEIRPVIMEYCGNLEDCFDLIEEEPAAAASLSQVHRAVLRDGHVVALKVQRPGIVDLIETDLLILQSLAARLESMFPDLQVYNAVGMVEEFAIQIRRELDFTQDGMNAERLRRNLRDVPGIRIPRIYWSLSGPRMLVMDYIEGVRIDDLEAIRAMGVSPVEIAEIGFYAYVKQIFVDGFFHGDPHAGNLLVTRQGEIAVLDYGIFGVIRPEKRKVFVDLLLSLSRTDVDGVLAALGGLGDDLYLMLLDYRETKLKRVNFAFAIRGLTDTLRRYHIRVPSSLMLIMKVIVMVMDLGVRLDPDFNFDRRIRPYLTDIAARQRFSMETLAGAADGLLALPGNVNEALRTLSEGTIKFEIDDRDLRQITGIVDRTSDKLLVGLVVAAIVVGSSLVIGVADVPIPESISVVATLGYVVAVLIGFYAVYDAFRHRRTLKQQK